MRAAASKTAEYINLCANEPALGLYRVQEHVQRVVPQHAEARTELARVASEAESAGHGAEYCAAAVRSMHDITAFGNIEQYLTMAIDFATQAAAAQKVLKARGAPYRFRAPPPGYASRLQLKHSLGPTPAPAPGPAPAPAPAPAQAESAESTSAVAKAVSQSLLQFDDEGASAAASASSISAEPSRSGGGGAVDSLLASAGADGSGAVLVPETAGAGAAAVDPFAQLNDLAIARKPDAGATGGGIKRKAF